MVIPKYIMAPTIKVLGYLMLLIGLIALYYGPYEIYCFYVFTSAGSFYYKDFTIGSLWFALLAVQNSGYYIAAFFLIPIGLGFIKLRKWGQMLLLNLLYVWMIFGTSLLSGFSFSIPRFAHILSLTAIGAIMVVLVIFGVIFPFLLTKLCNRKELIGILLPQDKDDSSLIFSPKIILVTTMNILVILFLHLSTFFKCIFPLFGRLLFLREGIYWIAGAILCLSVLTYLICRKRTAAFYGLVVYYALMFVTVILTIGKYSISEIIQLLNYSQYEHDHLISKFSALQNINATILIGSFLIIMIGIIVSCRNEFTTKKVTFINIS